MNVFSGRDSGESQAPLTIIIGCLTWMLVACISLVFLLGALISGVESPTSSLVSDGVKFISAQELYKRIKDSEFKILILDCRPYAKFAENRIQCSCCINIPAELLDQGYETYIVIILTGMVVSNWTISCQIYFSASSKLKLMLVKFW